MQQPLQIMKIENENIRLAGPRFSQCLKAAGIESRIQLLLIHAVAGGKTHQCRAQKTADQDRDQDLGCEFWQCG